MTALLGLTWDHPRGYRALDASAEAWRADGGPDVTWDRQPLEGFESIARRPMQVRERGRRRGLSQLGDRERRELTVSDDEIDVPPFLRG